MAIYVWESVDRAFVTKINRNPEFVFDKENAYIENYWIGEVVVVDFKVYTNLFIYVCHIVLFAHFSRVDSCIVFFPGK